MNIGTIVSVSSWAAARRTIVHVMRWASRSRGWKGTRLDHGPAFQRYVNVLRLHVVLLVCHRNVGGLVASRSHIFIHGLNIVETASLVEHAYLVALSPRGTVQPRLALAECLGCEGTSVSCLTLSQSWGKRGIRLRHGPRVFEIESREHFIPRLAVCHLWVLACKFAFVVEVLHGLGSKRRGWGCENLQP